ncbi:MAG TPA: SMP-30/gluconolactonase/LRE family protein [Candidatus Angelobacter sp.]|jgi:sugar lactone lactonase YvrE|nr:SMP-30/gluconolactonase/LRE family protein [Candidatus Angelobacter sp.]
MTPKTLLDDLVFPEGPRWHDRALYFSDMHAGIVWRLTPEGSATKVLQLPSLPSGLGWTPDGTLHVVSMLDRRFLRVNANGPSTVADLSSLAPYPINDMVIDGQGRAYIGTFGCDLNNGETPCPTKLFCVHPGGEITVAAEDVLFPNGVVITPDGKTLILAETFGSRLTAFDIALDGTLTNRRLFAQLEGTFPDGICLDEESAVWVASAGGNKIIRVTPGGKITDTIALPDRNSYACMLGGPDRRDLYICTARHYLPERTRALRSGKIEVVRVDVPGAGLP